MPKAIKRKSAKNVGSEVEVQDRLIDIKNRFRQKRKMVLIYGAIALCAIVVLSGIGFFRYSENKEAARLEYEAYKIYSNVTPLTGQEPLQQSLALFQQAYSKRRSPSILLYIADSYYALGKLDDAIKTLEDFLKRFQREEALLPLAYKKMAAVYIKKGNLEEALKALDRITNSPSDTLKDIALMESGKILELQGKKDEAIAKYKELSEKFPESPLIGEIKSKLGEKKAG